MFSDTGIQLSGASSFSAMTQSLCASPSARPIPCPQSKPVLEEEAASSSRFGHLASLKTANDIYSASTKFAEANSCTAFLPHLNYVPDTGIHPEPASYARLQCQAIGGLDATLAIDQVGDLIIWQAQAEDDRHLSGITYVSPSHSLGADLVIGVYRVGNSTGAVALTDDCIGQFTLLCTTIARPRNRALLSNFAPDFKPLTPRERQVLHLSTSGATAQDVADSLGITKRTVNAHVEACMAKLQCSTKSHAIVRAVRLGLI